MERKSRAAGAELEKHAAQLAEVEQAVTQVMGEMERLTAKRGHLRRDPPPNPSSALVTR